MKIHMRVVIALIVGGVIGAGISTLLFSSPAMNEHKKVSNQTANDNKASLSLIHI